MSGLCDSLSSVRICLSPSSCGCHAIFIVFFNSTTVTRSLPSLTSQINGSFLQRSLSLPPPSPLHRPANPLCKLLTAELGQDRGRARGRHALPPRLISPMPWREGRDSCFCFITAHLSALFFTCLRENSMKPARGPVRETRFSAVVNPLEGAPPGFLVAPRVGTSIAKAPDNVSRRKDF